MIGGVRVMLGQKDRRRNFFFDEEIFARMIPPDHSLVVIKQHVDFGFVEETVRPLYPALYGGDGAAQLSARDAVPHPVPGDCRPSLRCPGVDALRYNLRPGLRRPVPDDTTLVVFRRRLGEAGFRQLFARVVQAARQHCLLQGEWMIVDGTKVRSHAAERGTIELLREERRRVLKEVAQKDPEQAQTLEDLKDLSSRNFQPLTLPVVGGHPVPQGSYSVSWLPV
jgi:hypothetical protein